MESIVGFAFFVLEVVFFIIPANIIKGFETCLRFIGKYCKLTVIMIRFFVIEFGLFEFITELVPCMFGEDLYNAPVIVFIDDLLLSVQWDSDLCIRMGNYMATGIDEDLAPLFDKEFSWVLIIAIAVCSIGLCILGVIGVGIFLNLRYLAIGLAIDTILLIHRGYKSAKAVKEANVVIEKANDEKYGLMYEYGESGRLNFDDSI